MTSDVVFQGEGWHARLATREDNAALCALMRAVPMEGAVTLAQERDPDFFRLADMHRPGVSETYVACREPDGAVVGCGTLVLRDGWLPGRERARVGYISDLRVLPSFRGARVIPGLGRGALERARDAHGVHLLHTAVIDSNRRVVGTATSRRAARAAQPVSRPMTPYHMVAVPFRGRARAPPSRVARASPEDFLDLAKFLARESETRTFGYVFGRALLEARLARWPGLALDRFLLVRDGRGEIVACAAPWETSAFRRMRVVRYGRGMRLCRALHAALARATGATPLPREGECFRFATLSHLEVAGDDPTLLRDLVRAAYHDLQGSGFHFLSAFVPARSPLARAFPPLGVVRTPMTLFTTQLPESPLADVEFATDRPGFEMALA